MAYHIVLITNNSTSSVALTNPAYEADSVLIGPGPGTQYIPKRPIFINAMSGNPTYPQAIGTALNLYDSVDNFCFWDNTNSAINGVGEKSTMPPFNQPAGNLQVTINPNGTLTFAPAVTGASAGV